MEFYAFWNALQIRDLFEAIVFILGGSDYIGLLRAVAVVGALTITTVAIISQRHTDHFLFYAALAIFYTTLIIPRQNVVVRDVRTGASYVVANVPIGVALPATTASHVGYWLTNIFETAFIPANDTGKFSKFGMGFPQRIVTAVQNMGAVTPGGREMVTGFAKDCVVPEMIEMPAKASEIMSSANIWSTIGSTGWLNPARATVFPDGSVQQCDVAYLLVQTQIDTIEIPAMKKKLGNIVLPGYPDPSALVATALPLSETLMFGMSRTFQESMRQSLMMDAVPNGINLTGAAGQPLATAVSVATAQGNVTSTINYRAMAEIAKDALPKLRSAIEFLIIASFPFMLLMTVASGHKAGLVLRGFFVMLIWVQLWPPLYAAINYLVVMADSSPMTQLIAAEGGNSLLSIELVRQFGASAQDIAGMLTLSVPLIAYALAKGGEVATTSMISSVMAPAQSPAQQAGGQLAAGNVTFGNVSWGNTSSNNVGANSFDRTPRMADSSMASLRSADGEEVYSGDGSPSVLRASQTSLGAVSGQMSSRSDVGNTTRSSSGLSAAYGRVVSAIQGELSNIDGYLSGGYGRQLSDAIKQAGSVGSSGSSVATSGNSVRSQDGAIVRDAETYSGNINIAGNVGAGFGTGGSPGRAGRSGPVAQQSGPSVPASTTGAPASSVQSSAPSGSVPSATGAVAPASGSQAPAPVDMSVPVGRFLNVGVQAGGNANTTTSRGSERTTGTTAESSSGGRYDREIRALSSAEASSTDNGFKEAARGLRASYQRLSNLQDAQQAMVQEQRSASTEKSAGTTNSGQVGLNVDQQAVGALRSQGWTGSQIMRGARTGDAGVVGAVAAASSGSRDIAGFSGANLSAPDSPKSVDAWGRSQQSAVESGGRDAVQSHRAEGARAVSSYVPVDPSAGPNAGAFMQSFRGVERAFGDQVDKGRANDTTMAGVAAMATYLSAADKTGLGGTFGLFGQATGLSRLFGSPGLQSGQEFIASMKDLIGRSDEFPAAAAAVQQMGEKFIGGNLTPADVKQFDSVVSGALTSIRNQSRSSVPESGTTE